MFDSHKLLSLTHVTNTEPIAPKSDDFRVLGVKTPIRVELLRLGGLRNQIYLHFYFHQYYQYVFVFVFCKLYTIHFS